MRIPSAVNSTVNTSSGCCKAAHSFAERDKSGCSPVLQSQARTNLSSLALKRTYVLSGLKITAVPPSASDGAHSSAPPTRLPVTASHNSPVRTSTVTMRVPSGLNAALLKSSPPMGTAYFLESVHTSLPVVTLHTCALPPSLKVATSL